MSYLYEDQKILKKLKSHIEVYEMKHTVTQKHYLDGICIDKSAGLYFINENFKGGVHPIHVKKLTTSNGGQHLECQSSDYRNLSKLAERSAFPSFECDHIESIKYIKSFAEDIEMQSEFLDELVR